MLLKKSQDKTSEHDKLTNDANSDDAVDEAVHYNKSNDDNDSADNDNNNHRFFIPNSKYSTIVIYALLFVVGTILIYKFIGTFTTTHTVADFTAGTGRSTVERFYSSREVMCFRFQ